MIPKNVLWHFVVGLIIFTVTSGVVNAANADVGKNSKDSLDRYIIGLEPEFIITDVKSMENSLSSMGIEAKVLRMNKKLNFVVIESKCKLETLKEKLSKFKWVSYVEPDYLVKALYIPNDGYFYLQWGPQDINITKAWDVTLGNETLIVAVIDTGIDYNHPDLAANYVPLGYDWVNNDNDPFDDNGHGTHCAGIIAAVINNSIGVAGLAKVKIMAEKVLNSSGTGYTSDVANGITHAVDNGAKIISMSLGAQSYSITLDNACEYAWSNGALLVAASGNDYGGPVNYPAAYSTVIAVGSINRSDALSDFSNYGPQQELVAPGEGILSTYPDSTYAYASGTSMATPHAAGVAALAWATHPDYTNQQIRNILNATAIDLGSPGWDEYYGYGKVDAYKVVVYGLPSSFFTGVYSDYGLDEDGDGLYDYLVVEVGVYAVTSDTYVVSGVLHQNGTENFVSQTSTEVYLDEGPNTVQLYFRGEDIWKYGYLNNYNGTFDLRSLEVANSTSVLDSVDYAYTTSYYYYTDFERPSAFFTGNYTNYGLDFDNNDLYDRFVVEAEVLFNEPGSYTLGCDLRYFYDGILRS